MIRVKDKAIKASLQLSFLFLTGQLVVLLFFWPRLPPQVPLFYSRPWGKEQLTAPIGLLILPVISFLVTLINLAAASLMPKEEKLISQLLVLFGAIFSFLCLVTLFKIVILTT